MLGLHRGQGLVDGVVVGGEAIAVVRHWPEEGGGHARGLAECLLKRFKLNITDKTVECNILVV